MAIGYGWNGQSYDPQPYEVYTTTPASSIDSTVADMGRLLEALTGGGANTKGSLFSRTMTKKVLAPQFRAHPEFLGITHGMFESYTSDEADTKLHLRTVGHGGSMRGYRSALTIIPDRSLGVFITANRAPEAGGGDVDFRPVLRLLLEALVEGPERKLYPIPNNKDWEPQLEPYVGAYYYGTFCHDVTSEDLAQGAWRRGRPQIVTKTEFGIKIGEQKFVPRSKDVFVQSDGKRLVVFNRNRDGEISSFTYSSSPDTFERESAKFPYPDIRSLAQATFQRIERSGLASGARFFNDNKTSSSYYHSESEMNRVGYIFLQSDRNEAALRIFQWNAERFPDSWNVFDSLGDAYAKLKKDKLAIANYEKSIQLNPANEEGRKKAQALIQPN